MVNFLNKEEMGLGLMNSGLDNPSNLLPSKVKKMASGTLTNKGGGILYNGNPIGGIQGVVIVDGKVFAISENMQEQWEFRFDDSGNISFGLHIGGKHYSFSSYEKDNMQIFLYYGFAARGVLIVLDTRINKQGVIVNKGPKFAEQIETLFSIIFQYYAAIYNQRNAANNDTALPPQREPHERENDVCDRDGFNNE